MQEVNKIFSDVFERAEKWAESTISTSQDIITVQRSEEWFEKRKGKWTGSKIKDLMAKGRGNNIWGEKAKHYVFSRFMERLRETPDTSIFETWAMKRGVELEPYAIAAFEDRYPDLYVDECDFITFKDFPTAGASPDGIVKRRDNDMIVGIFETKARGDEQMYLHAFERVHEKHPDFWQLMAEMVAVDSDLAFYCHYTDLHEKPFDLQVQIVDRSPDHIIAMYERIKEADAIVNESLLIVGDIDDLMPSEVTERIIEARNFIYSR